MLSSSMSHAAAAAPAVAGDAQQQRLHGVAGHRANMVAQLRGARERLETFRLAFPALVPATRALARIEARLTRPLRFAIIGEFNSGKSSLANLLVGIDSLPTAVVSNTHIPTLLYFAANPEIFAVGVGGKRRPLDLARPASATDMARLEVGLPSPRLRSVQLIDLPGLADPRFENVADGLALHDVDAVLWCTVATQAWKESERIAWSLIVSRLRDRAILVVTHRDLLACAADETKLLARLHHMAGPAFQDIVVVSAVAGSDGDADGLAGLTGAIDRLAGVIGANRASKGAGIANRIAARALARIDGCRSTAAAP